MVGGAPVTRKWAEEIGADGYAKDAMSAVALARSLIEPKALPVREAV
jgi:methanogenic corrinoid protein MtbC1